MGRCSNREHCQNRKRNQPNSLIAQREPRQDCHSHVNRQRKSQLAHTQPQIWCTGEDSNLRSSKERQIYSLLPLTTRPPVRRAARSGLKSNLPNASFAGIAPQLHQAAKTKTNHVPEIFLEWSVLLSRPALRPACWRSKLELAKGFEPPTL